MSGLVVVDLAGENVTDQFTKLDGVAGPFKTLHCHAGSMAWLARGLKVYEIQTVPLPAEGVSSKIKRYFRWLGDGGS